MPAYLMIRVYCPGFTVAQMNTKINDSSLQHEGVNKILDLMGGIAGGCNPAEVDCATRDTTQVITPTAAGGASLPAGSPDLGTARSFSALAGSGFTNSGSSVFNGNIGSFPTTTITLGAGTVNGTVNVGAAAAQASALLAYGDLVSRPTTTIPSALDGQTLTAGAYSFASGAATLATSAPGTLTLNGSATDVFVIKTATTLTTGAGGAATIALTGGALASNVYFVVGSSATINVGTPGTFNGNIIAYTSITNTSGGAVNGSLIALNGAITYSTAATSSSVVPAAQPGDVAGQYVQYNLL